jgi:hypothetical protein
MSTNWSEKYLKADTATGGWWVYVKCGCSFIGVNLIKNGRDLLQLS